jgi:hypothetical protein
MTLTELLMAAAITCMIAGGMGLGISMLQHSFMAADHHAKSQLEQARLMDYISRDLRRAISVSVDTYEGSQRITMTIPDYYNPDGTPRDPVIAGGGVTYGNAAAPLRVAYYKSGSNLYRSVNENPTVLAREVQDFVPSYTDDGKQIVGLSVSFVPKFQLNDRDISSLRTGTTTYCTTLLRNKRKSS